MKIETEKKIYSFGLFLDYDDFLKINIMLQPKIKEYKDRKILLNKMKGKQEELLNSYNLKVEERYRKILNIILDEERIIISKKDDYYIVNASSEIIQDLEIFKNMNFKEIDFYIFYVNYLSKKEYEDKKVLVEYNGIDGKKVAILNLKKDLIKLINDKSIN